MRVVYNGPHDAVEVPELSIVVRRGEPVEVRDGDAKLLLLQDVWDEAPKTPDKPKGGNA